MIVWAEEGAVPFRAQRQAEFLQAQEDRWGDGEDAALSLDTLVQMYEDELFSLQPYL
jgi:hypothetical protein